MGAWASVKWRERAAALAEDLAGRGILTDRAWRTSLQEVPRHLFAPARAWAESQEWAGTSRVIDRGERPSDWWNAVYSDASIITQRDDGDTDPADPSGTPTCSLSCPSIVMEYLHLLDVGDHHRVLEIGTGTGWTAALLAWRLGGQGVVTMEVDKRLAEVARENLDHAPEQPDVVAGDGADGHPIRAPYDRVHVTCGVRSIPRAWIEQTRPGGVIVAPWMPIGGEAYGQQLRLDVIGDGTAVGRCHGGGGFMMLRSQRPAQPPEVDADDAWSTTRMDPELIVGVAGGAQLAVAGRVSGLSVAARWDKADDDRWTRTVTLSAPDGSEAACMARRGADDHDVAQAGPRALWSEVEDAYLWWLAQGRPGADRFGVTVMADGAMVVWLDRPDNWL